MELKLSAPVPPKELIDAIEKAASSLQYSEPKTMFHCVDVGRSSAFTRETGVRQFNYCGVFGDGDNATYEWFLWIDGKLRTSNVGYGVTECALRDALTEWWPK